MTFQSAFAPDFLEEGLPEKKGLRGGRSAEGTLFYITQPEFHWFGSCWPAD
jgi:hypothetical protein